MDSNWNRNMINVITYLVKYIVPFESEYFGDDDKALLRTFRFSLSLCSTLEQVAITLCKMSSKLSEGIVQSLMKKRYFNVSKSCMKFVKSFLKSSYFHSLLVMLPLFCFLCSSFFLSGNVLDSFMKC